MPGIVGVVNSRGDSQERAGRKQIGSMLDSIRHRGPDNSTVRISQKGAVGVTELNLSPSATYGFSGEEEPVVLLDGDLYNERPPGMSNVQFLKQLYLDHGKGCFSYLDGCFACAILEAEETILARDAVGVRSLVYGVDSDEKLYFASEAKALKDYISEVSILPPGHFYSTRDGLGTFEPFAPGLPDFDPDNLEETLGAVREAMIEAVGKCLKDGAVGGVALSGGFDSSLVTAILVKEFGVRLPQFTSTVRRAPGPDLSYSRMLAEYFGLADQHYVREITDEEIIEILPWAVWYLESFDQDCISGWIANYFTAKKAAEFTNCVLVGETADEISGGYFGELEDWYDQWADPTQREAVYQNLIDIAGDTGLKRLNQGWHAASVTPRTPFPDPKLLAIFRKIPMRWKYYEDCNQGRPIPEVPEKWILRKAFEDYLPPEIAWRKKMRFARGVGVDNLMDELAGNNIGQEEFERMPQTPITGMTLGSRKERHYYDLFISADLFPISYENLCVRWDPFIEANPAQEAD